MSTELPTKAQNNVIEDLDALHGIKDEVEKAIDHIEAQLEFSDRDAGWTRDAINALALHRNTVRMLNRQIAKIKAREPRGIAPGRLESTCDPLTLEVIANPPNINTASAATVKDVDIHIQWIAERINAMRADRTDEIARAPQDRDEAFLSLTGKLLGLLGAQRIALQSRRGEISREARRVAARERDQRREQMFIDAARELLDEATYRILWDRVDRAEIADASQSREAAA